MNFIDDISYSIRLQPTAMEFNFRYAYKCIEPHNIH
jgi:hypothetical protein